MPASLFNSISKIRILKAFVLACACIFALNSSNAETIKSEAGRFTVDMPGKAKYLYDTKRRQHAWMVDTGSKAWSVVYVDAPGISKRGFKYMYDIAQNSLFKDHTRKLLSSRDFRYRGVQAREVILRNNQGTILRNWYFMVGDRFYQVVYGGVAGSQHSKEADAFFNSFRLQKH